MNPLIRAEPEITQSRCRAHADARYIFNRPKSGPMRRTVVTCSNAIQVTIYNCRIRGRLAVCGLRVLVLKDLLGG